MLTALAWVLAAPVALPLLVFTAEVWAGLPRRNPATANEAAPRTTVLMPAHDEAGGIGRAIAAVLADAVDGVDVLVVADNCRDDTAAVARAAGARVVERTDPTRRGKGHALAFGRDALAADPPACVVVLDADCAMSGRDNARLAAVSVARNAATQALNLQRPRPELPPTAALSNFAFLVKNWVRQQGMMRLGGVAVLTGTGMAIPWDQLRDAPLATDDLAEDLALGVWLAGRRRPPQFSTAATVWSDAVAGADLIAQRSRWERGFLDTAARRALPQLARGLAHGSRSQAWLGLHLLVPPLALLVAIGAVTLLAAVLLALLGASWWPAAILALLLAAAGGGIVLAWSRYGRDQIAGRTLLAIPAYVAAKLPLYRKLFTGGPRHWQRTRRANEDER